MGVFKVLPTLAGKIDLCCVLLRGFQSEGVQVGVAFKAFDDALGGNVTVESQETEQFVAPAGVSAIGGGQERYRRVCVVVIWSKHVGIRLRDDGRDKRTLRRARHSIHGFLLPGSMWTILRATTRCSATVRSCLLGSHCQSM